MASISLTFLSLVAVMLIAIVFAWRLFRQATQLERRLHLADLTAANTLQNAEFHNLACEETSDGIIIQDDAGLILWCNPAYCRLHGRLATDILGRNPHDFTAHRRDAHSRRSFKINLLILLRTRGPYPRTNGQTADFSGSR